MCNYKTMKIGILGLRGVLLGGLLFSALFARTLGQSPSPSTAPDESKENLHSDGPAELPRKYVNSSLANTPAPGKIWRIPAGGDLQDALNRARCGDTVALEAGAEFTGHFILPAKDCDDNHWIIIRSGAPDTALPPEGTRITPCYAGAASLPGRPGFNCTSTQKVMATLVSAKGGGPITFAASAHHYRLGPGLEITRPVGTGINYGLIQPTDKMPADHIVVDRDWVHGTAQDETARGILLSGMIHVGIVDSYFTDFHCTAIIGACIDAQAVAGGSGDLEMGDWKIVNNFLEAAAENILFGGAKGSTVPTDIEIRRNYLFKPLTWMQGQSGFVGGVNSDPTKCVRFNTPGFCPFIVKNLFELKNAQRVLVEGNVMEHTWPGFTQHGAAVLFTPLSQGGKLGNPNATVADVTFRFNRVSHSASGIVIAEVAYEWGPPKLEARLSIHDDIFDDISPAYYNGDSTAVGLAFEIIQCGTCAPLQDILIDHLTMLLQTPKRFMLIGAPEGKPLERVIFTNNIVSTPREQSINGTGPNAPCGFRGTTPKDRMENCFAALRFEKNALIGAAETWPKNNFFPRDAKEVGFVRNNDLSQGDYHLAPTSRHKRAGTDGKDLGADIDAVEKATQGVTQSP